MGYTPKELRFMGVGKETAWGTGVASTFFVPFTDFKPADVPTVVDDKGIRGVMATEFGKYQSVRTSTMDLSGDVFPDSFGLLLLAMMGKDTVSGTTTKTHSFSLDPVNQPPSLTFNHYDGTNERAFAGHMVEELDIKWAKNALLTYTLKSAGKTSAVITTETPSITTTSPFLAWNFGLTIDGTANLNLESFELDLKRKSSPVHAANNSQDPSAVVLGGLEATGKVTFAKKDDTELQLALANTQGAVVLTGTQATTGYGITVTMTKAAFFTPTLSGSDFVEVDESFEGIYNTTDNGPCTISLINSTASY